MFNKEFYWSEGYYFFQNPYCGGEEWIDFSHRHSEISNELDPVLIPTLRYLSERAGDILDGGSASWYKPCGEIFKSLQLNYGKEDTVLYDRSEQIVCFDSDELLQEKIGFFMDQKCLEEFLNQHGYAIFWTMLAEKRIIQEFSF